MTCCAIWYRLKNTHGEVLILVKFQGLACNLLKVTLLHGFFTFFKLYKYTKLQNIQIIQNCAKYHICVMGVKVLTNVADVPPSPQSGISRKKIICTDKVYAIDHVGTSL